MPLPIQWHPAKLGIIIRKCEIAYVNDCLLYAYTHVFVDPSTGKRHEFHCCGLTGHGTLGGGTMDAMKEAAVRLALEHGPIGDERRFSRGEFEAMVD